MKLALLDVSIIGKFLIEHDLNKERLDEVFKETKSRNEYLNHRSSRYKHFLQTNSFELDYLHFEVNYKDAFPRHSERLIPKDAITAYMHDVSIMKSVWC